MSASQLYLKVLFILLSIRWVNFQVLLDFIHLEMIDRYTLIIGQWLFHFFIEMFGEIISILNSKDSLIEIDIGSNIEIFPSIEIHNSNFLRDFLSVYKNSLSDSRILDSWLGHVNGLVTQIVIHDARSHSKVFKLRFHHCLLEVAVESQNLSVEFKPLGLNSWNIVVFGGLSFFLEVSRSFCSESLK